MIFGIEIAVILILVLGFWVVSKLDKIQKMCIRDSNKGYALYGGRYKYEEDQKVFHLMTYLEDILADEPYLYFVPASICVDSANNFDMTEEPVNPYSDEMQEVPTDAVHPGRAAYEQIADCLYLSLIHI